MHAVTGNWFLLLISSWYVSELCLFRAETQYINMYRLAIFLEPYGHFILEH